MTLAIYTEAHEDAVLTSQNPFTVTFDGRLGGYQMKQLFVRNDNVDYTYTNITVQPIDTAGLGIVDDTLTGFYWKLLEKSVPPAIEEWTTVTKGNTLSLSSDLGSSLLGDTTTFLPFWVQIAIPRNQPIQILSSVVLRISAMEYVV